MSAPSPMDPAAYHVVMFSFTGTDEAPRVVHRLREEDALAGCEIEAEALISREPSGKVHYHEKGSAGIGAAFGATTAGLLGLVGGPVILLLMVLVGGIAGGLAGHFAGLTVPREDLRRVAEMLPPDSSAYLAVVDAKHAAGLARAFESEGARVLDLPVHVELASAIRETIMHEVTPPTA